MISYTRTHILSTVSSVRCCVVAYVATEPETVFTDDFFTKPHVLDAGEIAGIWEPSERENAGKCDRIGASHSHLREEPPKRPPIRRWLPSNGTGRQWIPKRDFLAGFLGISSDFADTVDVLGRP